MLSVRSCFEALKQHLHSRCFNSSVVADVVVVAAVAQKELDVAGDLRMLMPRTRSKTLCLENFLKMLFMGAIVAVSVVAVVVDKKRPYCE